MSEREKPSPRFFERAPVVVALVIGWLVAFSLGMRLDMLYTLFAGYAFLVCVCSVGLFAFDLKPPKGPTLVTWLGAVVFGVVGVSVAHVVFSLFESYAPFLANEVKALFAALAPKGALDIVAMGFVVVAEELLFRGLLQRMLERVFSPSLKVIRLYALQIFVYALAQMGTLSLSVFMAGIALGIGVSALAKWSRSLWPPIIGHALWTYGVVVVFPLEAAAI